MRIVVADCSADYSGRLTTRLARGVRLIMVKGDGSFLVHADDGSYKPLNWMNSPNTVEVIEEDGSDPVWVVTSKDGKERLALTVHEVVSDTEHTLDCGGLERDGVEDDLQRLLAADPTVVADGLRLVRREFPTPVGPVDLMCMDESGNPVAVEVKRAASIDAVYQMDRYIETLQASRNDMDDLTGHLVALSFTPQTRVLAERRGYPCVVVDYEALRDGREPEPVAENPTLF